MRITGGKFGGRRLAAPGDDSIRPTSDKVRQAIFNILKHQDFGIALEGARAADLFAGTGALGLEAISHGAAFCLFIEDAAASRALIHRNIERSGADRHDKDLAARCDPFGRDGAGRGWSVRPRLSRSALPQRSLAPALASLSEGGWLAPGALLIVETAEGEILTEKGFRILDARVYGETQVSFLRAATTP